MAAADGDDATVELLLSRGADINLAGKSGETALMLAAKNDRQTTVILLLKKGANVNAKTKQGNTARDIAKRHGHLFVSDMLADAAEATVVAEKE